MQNLETFEIIAKYVKPELLILIPVLYLVGMAIKKSNMKDSLIPLTLGITGVFLAILRVLATTNISSYQEGLMAVFTAITQGILCAGASVYINQIIVQKNKD